MTGEVAAGDYRDVVLFLATAGVVVPIFRRWNLSPILGFLGAGVILGPFGLGAFHLAVPWLSYFTIKNPAQMTQLAEFGVVFLLFAIGLELSWERLQTMRHLVFGLGSLQVALCATAIAGIAILFGQDPVAAALIGAALALSSTAIVMPLLAEQKRQYSRPGRVTFSVLLFQDLAVAPILVTIAVLGGHRGESFSPKLLLAFAPAALGVLGLVVLGRLVLRPMMRSVAKAKSEELFVAASLLVVIGAGLVAAVTGLSMALGAFIAGLLLAETEYRREVETTVEPFKGLLLGLFFVSVGSGLDLSLLAANPVLIVGAMLGLMMLNGGIIFGLARAFGLRNRAAIETALLLAASGEFAFVVLTAAVEEGLLDRQLSQTILVSSTLSMFCIPMLAAVGATISRRASKESGPVLPEPERAGGSKVLVVGYGRVGKLVAEMLTRHQIPWMAIERVPKLIEAGRRAGHDVFFGDASRSELLQRFGLNAVLALVVTTDSPEATEAVVVNARELRPDLTIVARARDAQQAKRLYELGASDAVPETIEASLQLSEALLVGIGIPTGSVIASIHQRRDEFRKELNNPNALGGRGRRIRQH
jgi:monovalent cation:H+ antiporter-2, CPA2 family